MEHHWTNEYIADQILVAVSKLMEMRAELMEPHFAEKVLERNVRQAHALSSVCKIILCVTANFEVCNPMFKIFYSFLYFQ